MGLRDLVGLRGKAPPVTNDALSEKRHECYAFHTILSSLRDDSKQLHTVLQNIALKEAKSTEFAKSLLEADRASWPEFEKVTKQYSDAYSIIYRNYESQTRPNLNKLILNLDNNVAATQSCIKKIEARDVLHQKTIDAGNEVERLEKVGKNTGKAESSHQKLKEEFTKATEELSNTLDNVLANRKKFLSETLRSLVTIQSSFFSVVNSEIGKCSVSVL